ncbi:MAG: winged helix-turn-helix transcriptional regulator [Alphaproteobacteria bacterium]|jgi:DNA-binding MarR family transcriptional regulator|nr:winged helix-turn-helix transcriptional regulator [Alphaproteobacteria bacterium]MDP6515395.1 winged helix-turn-helix transcriptional regulator [Alphaproteobacteria bacterium]
MNREAREQSIIRGLLERIDDSSEVDQRTLSEELGIALGMTNAYVKRCVKKGWIKVKQVPARRYRYYLTPKGFAEKTRLTAQFFSDSLTFFRRARQSFTRLYGELAADGRRRVVLCGVDDLTEIAILCALDHTIEVVGVFDPEGLSGTMYGIPPVRPDQAIEADAWVLAVNHDAAKTYRLVGETVGPEWVVVPDILARMVARPS